LEGVNLEVQAGEHVRIDSEQACGEALMRLLAGLTKPEAGQVLVAGKPVHDLDEAEAAAFRNTALGICLRRPALMARLAVWENVALPLAARGIDVEKRKAAALEALDAMGIRYCAYALPGSLSPYEASMASVARALTAQPMILLLEDIAADLPKLEAGRLEERLCAAVQYTASTALIFASSASGVPVNRRLRLENGFIREES
jgi:predicted ABC-type transport system involved in lysophospholipase L1 biosynthesis ATPase subunit